MDKEIEIKEDPQLALRLQDRRERRAFISGMISFVVILLALTAALGPLVVRWWAWGFAG